MSANLIFLLCFSAIFVCFVNFKCEVIWCKNKKEYVGAEIIAEPAGSDHGPLDGQRMKLVMDFAMSIASVDISVKCV